MCEYYTQKPADSCLANMLGYLTPLPYNICRGCLGILASMNFCLVAVLRCFALAGIVCLEHWVSQLQKINKGSPPNHCVVLVPLGSSTTLKMWTSCFGVGGGSPDAHLNITCKTLWVRCCCQIFLSHSGMPFWNLVMHRSFLLVKAVGYTSVHPRGSELDVVAKVTYPLSSWCCAGTAFSTFGSWDPFLLWIAQTCEDSAMQNKRSCKLAGRSFLRHLDAAFQRPAHGSHPWMWSQKSHILYPVDAVPALLFQLLGHETLSFCG